MPVTNGKSWIRTSSGKPFSPTDPNPGILDITDIAHALAHQCRFSGHTRYFYSVAQHAVHVSEIIAKGFEKAGLMHDASEAYLQDMPTPVKSLMPQYKVAEKALQRIIENWCGLSAGSSDQVAVHSADLQMLATEARDLMGNPQDWPVLTGIMPCKWKVQPWAPAYAKERFIERYNELWLS